MTRLRWCFYVPGIPFDGYSEASPRGLGGSETAALCLARSLVRRGHEVTLFCNTEHGGTFAGVEYLPMALFVPFVRATPHDVTVVQRMVEPFNGRTAGKLNIFWTHDLVSSRDRAAVVGCCWNIDAIASVSAFHAAQWQRALDLPPEAFFITRNGIEPELIAKAEARGRRETHQLLYVARPERGLDRLLTEIMPKLIAAEPKVRLLIAGYANEVERFATFYAALNAEAAKLSDNVTVLGSLSKPALYGLMKESTVYLYPNPGRALPNFAEVSCIAVMEAMACGLPIVSAARGALMETVHPYAGRLIGLDPDDAGWADAYAQETLTILRDPQLAREMGKAGIEAARSLSWDGVAEQWEAEALSRIAKLNDDPVRLARHFIRLSDIMAAEEVVERGLAAAAPGSALAQELTEIGDHLQAGWAFRDNRKAYREQYEAIGLTHTDAFAGGSMEPRLGMICDWFASHPEIKSVVDLGCGLGIYAINLSNRLGPDVRVHGIDIDKSTVEWAQRYRVEHALYPDALTFTTGDERLETRKLADAGMCCEVLEHVPDPAAFLELFESKVLEGGWCYVTVPFGPWEEISYRSYPHRCHLWHYEPADILDMWRHKPGVVVSAKAGGWSPVDGSALGHIHIQWRADHKPFGRIDMDRKLAMQRPRQSLSVCIMAGGGDVGDTLEWCCKSFVAIADEIIIANTGIDAACRARLTAFGARFIEAPDPKIEGFEAPRNIALAEARGDWVLWIDLDEKLMMPEALPKYLRQNIFDGYGLRQHHFSVDTTFTPDMPVRLIRRRNRNDGKEIRFWGMLHEHPEVAVNEGPGRVCVLSDVSLAHVGYLAEGGRRQRFWRNLPMLRKDQETYPERRLQKHFLCRDNLLLARYNLELNGGRLTPDLVALAEEVVAIYREHFLGKPVMPGVNTLQYYSQALRLLGRGVDVQFDIAVARDGQGDPINPATAMRFASTAEAMAELQSRAEQAFAPYASPDW